MKVLVLAPAAGDGRWRVRCDGRPVFAAGLLGLAVAVLGGCGQPPGEVTSGTAIAYALPDESTDASASPVGTAATVSEADALEFARRMSEAFETNSVTSFQRLLDADGMLDRAWKGIEVNPTTRNAFDTGVKQTLLRGDSPWFREIRQALEAGGSYELLRVRDREGDRTAIFRLVHNGGGLNYQEFRVTKRPDGELWADDMHVLLSGEWISETLHRSCLAVAADLDRGLIEKLTGKQSLMMKHINDIARMVQAEQQGDHFGALQIFASLPPGLQTDKNVLLVRFRAASNSDRDDLYMAAMSDVLKHLPGDPCAEFMAIDYYLMRNEFAAALASIDQVDRWVGGDGYLNVMRAGIHAANEDLEGMRRAGLAAVEGAPEMVDGYWTMINCENLAGNYDEVVRWVKALSQIDPHEANDFIGADGFEAFVASDAFQRWQQSDLGFD